ncbi:DUF333 domain-containing protein [Neisseria subflava]|uniref:DUF333 domain-containing protein n=1 Tax=Neisseria subflava TaxID=28449 RepID=UPI000D30BB01
MGSANPASGFCLKHSGKLEMTRDRNAIGLRYLPNGRLLKNGNIPINRINKFKFKILLS